MYRFALKMSVNVISNSFELNNYPDVKNLQNLNHENIIKYIENFMYEGRVCIITEYYKV